MREWSGWWLGESPWQGVACHRSGCAAADGSPATKDFLAAYLCSQLLLLLTAKVARQEVQR